MLCEPISMRLTEHRNKMGLFLGYFLHFFSLLIVVILPARMMRTMQTFQPLARHMRVNLRGRNIGMAK
jgi:hypothetical protein